ncbi:hypothetical protein PG999_010343 [Apiospora kogelbergensis]|uniref:Uncharacterized protein n=1 Tax=Apiospora kogelbergensis TaxID=1337665 RepID=A0AAW0QCL9_9PEZI
MRLQTEPIEVVQSILPIILPCLLREGLQLEGGLEISTVGRQNAWSGAGLVIGRVIRVVPSCKPIGQV